MGPWNYYNNRPYLFNSNIRLEKKIDNSISGKKRGDKFAIR